MLFHSFVALRNAVRVPQGRDMTYCCDLSGVEHLNLKNAKPSQTGVTDRATEGLRMRMIFVRLWAEGTNHRKENSDDLL
jgi:hypothetical protein